jgi:predicted nuclease of predicted toxin-antitoxin system
MRLLLDAHVSGPNVGRRLQASGHDVRALDQESALEGLDDDEVLALAATEQRILVTHNVADFPRILREWATAQRTHAGVILVYGIDHSEFALIIRGIERWLELRPAQADWSDVPAILDRKFARR